MSVPSSGADASSGNVGTSHLGRYELVCEIAKAQLGALWAGAADGEAVFVRRVGLGTPLPAALNEHLSDAARWAASARLPGFAPVLDVVATNDEIGVVSEFRDGECLRALLRQASFKRTPLPLGVALRIAVDVIDALEATEGLDRITPASLWPDSVLVGSDGVTSLLDLGVASVVAADPAWSAHPELASYSAPEKLEDAASANSRSDVFVVGILLWEMIANQRLFTGLSAPAARQKVLTAPVSRLDASKIGAPASSELADIVERALNRNPSVRFFDVTELRAALEANFSDIIASPAEVGAALSQISGSLMSIRRRAIDKALGSGAKHAAIPAETVEKLRGVPANATLLGVAPLASGSAPTPSNSANPKPVRSGTLLGFPSPDLSKAEEPAFPRRPPTPPPPRALRPTGVQREDSVDDLLAPLAGLEPERDELESLDDLLDAVKPLPKLTPPPPPAPPPRTMSTTAPLGTIGSDSVAPNSVDALIQSARGSARPAPFASSTAPMMAQTAPLGTDVMAQFGPAGVPPPAVPSSFPPGDPGARPLSEPPPGLGAWPISMALRRNRKIVIGVVAAMALLLTVAIVIGAVRSRSTAKETADPGKSKTAKSDTPDKSAAKAAAATPPPKQARSAPATPKKTAAAAKDEAGEAAGEKVEAKTSAKATLAAAQTKTRAAPAPKGGLKPAAKAKPTPKKPAAPAAKAKKPTPAKAAKAKPAKGAKTGKAAKATKPPAKKKPAAKPGKKVAAKKPH